ncbi:class I SAM-dependent methyltransferase [Halocatena halophila]|uniref:class I SAM-dependent methyltransferase n=1 Tax=Halocatena halophila TaxID=2814576 RepID=UPI002ED53A1B
MNRVPCVRVRPSEGEATRTELAGRELLDPSRKITVEDGWLYIPVIEPPSAFEVEYRSPPQRDRQTTPEDVLGFSPRYERIGDVALLDEDDPDRAAEIATALCESDLPIESVLNRASKVKGELRVRDWDVLAGDPITVHREYGMGFELDLSAVYFSPRLATERHRVIEQVGADERLLDMFAGVGPFVIPAAAKGATTVGVDLNSVAVDYLERNAERNDVAARVTAIEGDVRTIDYTGWADRLVMNLPHSANEFLETAVRLAGDECWIHYYDIQHEDDPFGPGEAAIRDVATEYDVTVEHEQVVRSYAPHELNVCLDVRLS